MDEKIQDPLANLAFVKMLLFTFVRFDSSERGIEKTAILDMNFKWQTTLGCVAGLFTALFAADRPPKDCEPRMIWAIRKCRVTIHGDFCATANAFVDPGSPIEFTVMGHYW